jgi:hypothetical protein
LIKLIEQKINIAQLDEQILVKQIEERNIINSQNVVHLTSNGGSVYPHSEQLIGVIDGVNIDFITTYEFKNNFTFVFKNGIKQSLGKDYFEIGNSIIRFVEAPKNDVFEDDLSIIYFEK